jgi:hypothetical protein
LAGALGKEHLISPRLFLFPDPQEIQFCEANPSTINAIVMTRVQVKQKIQV